MSVSFFLSAQEFHIHEWRVAEGCGVCINKGVFGRARFQGAGISQAASGDKCFPETSVNPFCPDPEYHCQLRCHGSVDGCPRLLLPTSHPLAPLVYSFLELGCSSEL